jgi:hypothetical protein
LTGKIELESLDGWIKSAGKEKEIEDFLKARGFKDAQIQKALAGYYSFYLSF